MPLCTNIANRQVPCMRSTSLSPPSVTKSPLPLTSKGIGDSLGFSPFPTTCSIYDHDTCSRFEAPSSSDVFWGEIPSWLGDIGSSVLNRLKTAKIWTYEVVCKEPKMEVTCQIVGDATVNVWNVVKYIGKSIRDTGKWVYDIESLNCFPFNTRAWRWGIGPTCRLFPEDCKEIRFRARCAIIAATVIAVIGCLFVFRKIFSSRSIVVNLHQPFVINNHDVLPRNSETDEGTSKNGNE